MCNTTVTFIQCRDQTQGFTCARQAFHWAQPHSHPAQSLPRAHRGGCEVWKDFASPLLDGQHRPTGHGGHVTAWKPQASSVLMAVCFPLLPPPPPPPRSRAMASLTGAHVGSNSSVRVPRLSQHLTAMPVLRAERGPASRGLPWLREIINNNE